MIPLIGLIYKNFGRNKAECMKALENSEKEIIALLNTQENSSNNGRIRLGILDG